MVDSDTSSIGTITIAESFLNIRKEFPESWIWQSIDMSNETGQEVLRMILGHANVITHFFIVNTSRDLILLTPTRVIVVRSYDDK